MLILQTKKLVKILALFSCSGLLLLSLFPLVTSAAFTKQINYQGKLTNALGSPVTDGTYSIAFRLYDDPLVGNIVWTETDSVSVQGGLFSLMLGANTSLDNVNFNQPLYLTLNVSNDGWMSPRKTLGAVASAFQSSRLDGSASTTNVDVSGYLNINGGTLVASLGNSIFETGKTVYDGLVSMGDVFTGGYGSSPDGIGLVGNGQIGFAGTGQYAGGIGYGQTVGVLGISPVAGIYGMGEVVGGGFVSQGDGSTGVNVFNWGDGGKGIDLYTTNADYGLYINSGSTTNYSIYSVKGVNYFGGNLGLGTTSPSEKLTVENGSILALNSDSYFKTGTTMTDNIFMGPDIVVGSFASSSGGVGQYGYGLVGQYGQGIFGVLGYGSNVGIIGLSYNGGTGGAFDASGNNSTGLSVNQEGIGGTGVDIYSSNGDYGLNVYNGNASGYSIYSTGGLNYFGGATTIGNNLNIGNGFGITLGGEYRTTWPVSGSGSSAGSFWATSSNSLVGYPSLSGDYAIVVGAGATTSDVRFEVAGNTKLTGDLFTSGNATTSGILALATTTVSGDLILSAGKYLKYNGINLAYASTTKLNYFFGGAGNITMTGNSNNAFGPSSLVSNSNGTGNSAFGTASLSVNTSGSQNSAFGYNSLYSNNAGGNNVAFGFNSGFGSLPDERSVSDNGMVFLGSGASRDQTIASTSVLTNGIALGYNAKVGGSNMMALGGTSTYAVKVGIGTSTPNAYLNIYGASSASDLFRVATSTNQSILLLDNNGLLSLSGSINIAAGKSYKYNGVNIAYGSTTLSNYFFGGAGNSTMTGGSNVALGHASLLSNTTGAFNAAYGYQSLVSNTTGSYNVANGGYSLYRNITGSNNVANGYSSLQYNTTGSYNVANGQDTLSFNTDGNYNVANGYRALQYASSSVGMIAIGAYSGMTSGLSADYNSVVDTYSTFLGYSATRDSNIASTSAITNATAIGYNAKVGGSNMMALGGTGAYSVKVGIGTSTPSQALDVFGSIQISKGNYLKYDGANLAYGSTTLSNYFFGGGSGNLSMTGSFNNVFGGSAFNSNTTGSSNNAFGHYSLLSNTTGSDNSAFGEHALAGNVSGVSNSSFGSHSMDRNVSGSYNTALGVEALFGGFTGSGNVAIGYNSLAYASSTTGVTAVGYMSGRGTSGVDYQSLVDTYSTFLGYMASRDSNIASTTALTNATAIGYKARVGTSSALVLGGVGAEAVRVGIGTSTPNAFLDIVGNYTSLGASSYGQRSAYNFAPALSSAYPQYGSYLEAVASSTSGVNLTGGVTGSAVYASHYGSGAATSLYGLVSGINNYGSGLVTNAYGLYLASSTGLISNNYGIYQMGTTTNNYFAGNIGIGTTSPARSLVINTKFAGDGLYVDGSSTFSPFIGFNKSGTFAGGLGVALNSNHGLNGAAVNDMSLYSVLAGSNLLFGASSTEYMRITGSGNIGMGTTTPLAALDIYNSRNLSNYTSNFDSTTTLLPESAILSAGYQLENMGRNSVMIGAYSSSTMPYTFSYGHNNGFTSFGGLGEYNTVFGSNNRFLLSLGSFLTGNNNYVHILGTAFVFGNENDVSGIGAQQFVLGNNNAVTSLFGDNYVFGSDNRLGTANNFVVGNNNNLHQEGSYVFGSNNYNYDGNTSAPSYILGSYSTTTTGDAYVFGRNITVSATSSVLFGLNGSRYEVNKNYVFSIMGATNGVGIGTTTPAAQLAVQGNTYLGGTLSATGTVTFLATYSDTVGGTNRDLYVDNTGKLGYVSSSRIFKENIVDATGTDWIYGLRPVHFDYIDRTRGSNQIGLIAEEVEQINPMVVSYSNDERHVPETVNYTSPYMITSILAEVQKLNSKLSAQVASGTIDTSIPENLNIKSIVSTMGSWSIDENGLLRTKSLEVTDSLKIGSPDKRIGFTLYDEQSGDPYCVSMSGGSIKNTKGECGLATPPVIIPPGGGTITGTSTDPVVGTSTDPVVGSSTDPIIDQTGYGTP